MGILVDAASIVIGGLIGGKFKQKITFQSNSAFAIGVMLISLVGFLEKLFLVSEGGISSDHIVVVVLALIGGCAIGDWLRLEERLSGLAGKHASSLSGIIDATLFFGIGGLQISGPILLALQRDSFQLYLKAVIDFPFALMMGATYGKRISVAAIPVAFLQVLIAIAAYFAAPFLGDDLLRQLCSLGYIILFFTGFNMVCGSANKIKNINMIPGIFIIILYHVILEVVL